MQRTAKPMMALLVLVLLMGAGHGAWTNRWTQTGELKRHLELLDHVPINFGDWKGEEMPYEPEDMARAGINGCIIRRYKNQRTDAAISLLIVCGRGGPISVHTPDVCYASAGYRQVAPQERVQTGEASIDVWKAYFEMPSSVLPKKLEISWTWSQDGSTWSSPDNPRYAFARFPAVYKMYVVREISSATGVDDDTSKEFLNRLLPELRSSLGVPTK